MTKVQKMYHIDASGLVLLVRLGFEAKSPGNDTGLEGINGGCVREEAVDHTSLDEVNGIGYIDLGCGRIYSQSVISSWRSS